MHKMIEQSERNLCQTYVVICEMANVMGIYTGLSGAAIVQTLVVIIVFM